MTRARDLADSADKDIAGTLTADDVTVTDTSPLLDVKGDGDGFPTFKIRRVNGVTKDNQSYYYRVTSGGELLLVDETDSNKNRMQVFDSGDISFFASDGTTQGFYWDASTQRLGLGTTSPDRQLHLETETGGILRFARNDTTVGDDANIGLIEFETQDSGSAGVGAYISAVGDGTGGQVRLEFATGTGGSATENMVIDSDGNVGIGTASPGSYYATGLVVDGSDSNGITVSSGTSDSVGLYFADGTSGDDRFRGYVQYEHTNNDLLLGTNGAERLRIKGDGTWGKAPAGTILQVVAVSDATQEFTSGSTDHDTNLSATITPTSSSSKILVVLNAQIGGNLNGGCYIKRGSTKIGQVGGSSSAYNRDSNFFNTDDFVHNDYVVNTLSTTLEDSPSTTSATTYTFGYRRGTTGSGNFSYNRFVDSASSVSRSTITLIEVSA